MQSLFFIPAENKLAAVDDHTEPPAGSVRFASEQQLNELAHEPLAGASPPGHHFIRDQQHPVALVDSSCVIAKISTGAYLGLCPDNDISGGKVLWRGARRTKNRAGTLFRMAAHSLYRDQTPIRHYLRRMKAKLGPTAATTATAHKITIIFYTMVKRQVEYDAFLWEQRDALREKRLDARLHKQAAQRGFKLVPLEPAA